MTCIFHKVSASESSCGECTLTPTPRGSLSSSQCIRYLFRVWVMLLLWGVWTSCPSGSPVQALVCSPASSAINNCVGAQPHTTTGNLSSWDKTVGLKKLMIMPIQPLVEKRCHLQPLSASLGGNEGLGSPWLQRLIVTMENRCQVDGGW